MQWDSCLPSTLKPTCADTLAHPMHAHARVCAAGTGSLPPRRRMKSIRSIRTGVPSWRLPPMRRRQKALPLLARASSRGRWEPDPTPSLCMTAAVAAAPAAAVTMTMRRVARTERLHPLPVSHLCWWQGLPCASLAGGDCLISCRQPLLLARRLQPVIAAPYGAPALSPFLMKQSRAAPATMRARLAWRRRR